MQQAQAAPCDPVYFYVERKAKALRGKSDIFDALLSKADSL
jgi:hypothetical protein